MRRDAVLREDVLSSDVIFADGIAVVWAGRLLGGALPERVAGIDLMTGMLGAAATPATRLLPGRHEEVLDGVRRAHRGGLSRASRSRAPGRLLQGRRGEQAVAAASRASRADILFVAMTSPEEGEVPGPLERDAGVPVCHGVGGSFDVMAGKVERAPELWQRLGLEWLYRVKQEPRPALAALSGHQRAVLRDAVRRRGSARCPAASPARPKPPRRASGIDPPVGCCTWSSSGSPSTPGATGSRRCAA